MASNDEAQGLLAAQRATFDSENAATEARIASKPYRIWTLHCPFKKNGFPSVGTFGTSVRPVVIISMSEWKRMCAEIPGLATARFEVGEYAE